MAGHVFVSFGPADSGYVQQLVFHLTAAGITTLTGSQGETAERIASSAALVAVVGAQGPPSEDVTGEIEQARAAHRPVLALVLGEGAPPAEVAGMPHESIPGGAMPSVSFVDQLRRLTAGSATADAPTIVPGPAPRFTDAVPVAAKKKSRRGLVIGLVGGVVLLLLLCVGVAAAIGMSRARTTAPERAAVGDCLTGTASGELDADTARKVDCSSKDAKFTVVARVEGKTFDESEGACAKDVDFVFWSGKQQTEPGTVLCLKKK
jgi:hypothetical protein